jgi:hypothetical protein
VTGWELDGPALDALGEPADKGQRCPECACPLDEHAPDGGHAIDCIVVNCRNAIGRVAVPGLPPCRVRACAWPSVRVGHCVEHDTPAVRAMARPHAYVFEGRRIVLESRPWATVPAEAVAADQQMAVITTSAPIAPALTTPPSLAPRATGRPCWAWCGRPGPAPHCHPASRYGRAPTFPCLVCGREIHACEGDVLLCRDDCAEFVRDLETLGPAQTSAAWFVDSEREAWEERAAMLQDSGMHRAAAERRAVLIVWRASRNSAPARTNQEGGRPHPTVTRGQLALFLP